MCNGDGIAGAPLLNGMLWWLTREDGLFQKYF